MCSLVYCKVHLLTFGEATYDFDIYLYGTTQETVENYAPTKGVQSDTSLNQQSVSLLVPMLDQMYLHLCFVVKFC